MIKKILPLLLSLSIANSARATSNTPVIGDTINPSGSNTSTTIPKNVSMGGTITFSIVNSSSGTTNNTIAAFSSTGAIKATTSQTNGVLGIVVSGGGTSGNAQVALIGQPSCAFDNATTTGDYVVVSTSTGGDCHDAGSSQPTGVQILGRVTSTNGGAGTYAVAVTGGSGGGGVSLPVSIANGGTGQTGVTAAFNALSPTTTTGDTIVYNGTNDVNLGVPGDNGRLIPDSTQTKGWRQAGYTQWQNGAPITNLIQYGDFENNSTTGWALGTTGTLTNGLPTGTPTFGSGASGTLSISSSSVSAIDGGFSLAIVSTGATTAGNMAHSSAYTVPPGYRTKTVGVRWLWNINSGSSNANFSGSSSNSYAWGAYDVTNSTWLPVNNPFCIGSVASTCYGASVTYGLTTASVRFVIYFPAATSGAATILVDDIYNGPMGSVTGPVMLDWQSCTPTLGWTGGNVTSSFFCKREGDSLLMNGHVALTGAPTGTNLTVSVPNGWTLDTTKITNSNVPYGEAVMVRSGSNTIRTMVRVASTTSVQLFYDSPGTSPSIDSVFNAVTATAPYTFGSGDTVDILTTKIPIVGWSSNMYLDSSTRLTPTYTIITTSGCSPAANCSGGNYIHPAGVTSLDVIVLGGGSGGNGSATSAANDGHASVAGAASTFGSSLLTSNGGQSGSGTGGDGGGTCTINSPALTVKSFQGSSGAGGAFGVINPAGGAGGASPFAGQGQGGGGGGVGAAAQSNTGSGGQGGGGASSGLAGIGGGGGGSACYLEALLMTPLSSYPFSVAAVGSCPGGAGCGGAAGTSGFIGGAGASGVILITENYPNQGTTGFSSKASARYSASTTQSIANNSTTNLTIFGTKSYDTTGTFNSSTGAYTVSESGKYRATLQVAANGTVAATVATALEPFISQAGSSTQSTHGAAWASTTTATGYSALISDTFNCLAGDTLTFQAFTNLTGSSLTVGSGLVPMYITIEELGN